MKVRSFFLDILGMSISHESIRKNIPQREVLPHMNVPVISFMMSSMSAYTGRRDTEHCSRIPRPVDS